MDLKRLQAEQARLYTSARERAEAGVGEEVERFAQSLVRKRLGEVRRSLPRTFDSLGEDGPRLFSAYAEDRPLGSRHPHLVDAVQFAEEVVRTELARYEAAALRAWMGETPHILTLRTRVDERFTGAPRYGRAWVVWWRWGGRLHRRVIACPLC